MIALINTNPEKYNKSFLRMLFSKDEEDKFYLCYRKDNINQIITFISFDSFIPYYDGFTKMKGIYYYDESNRKIINEETGEIVKIEELTYDDSGEYDKETNTIWINEEIKDDKFYKSHVFGLYLLSEVDKEVVKRNIEIHDVVDRADFYVIEIDNQLSDVLKRNNLKLTENTSIISLPITKEIDTFTGKVSYSGLENLNQYIKEINYTGEIKKEILEEYNRTIKDAEESIRNYFTSRINIIKIKDKENDIFDVEVYVSSKISAKILKKNGALVARANKNVCIIKIPGLWEYDNNKKRFIKEEDLFDLIRGYETVKIKVIKEY